MMRHECKKKKTTQCFMLNLGLHTGHNRLKCHLLNKVKFCGTDVSIPDMCKVTFHHMQKKLPRCNKQRKHMWSSLHSKLGKHLRARLQIDLYICPSLNYISSSQITTQHRVYSKSLFCMTT